VQQRRDLISYGEGVAIPRSHSEAGAGVAPEKVNLADLISHGVEKFSRVGRPRRR